MRIARDHRPARARGARPARARGAQPARARGALLRALWAPLLAAMLALAPLGLAAQEAAAPALPDPLTPEAARALVAELSDQEVRGLLLERAEAAEAAAPTPGIADAAAAVGGHLIDQVFNLGARWRGLVDTLAIFGAEGGFGGAMLLIVLMVLAGAVGFALTFAVRRAVAAAWKEPELYVAVETPPEPAPAPAPPAAPEAAAPEAVVAGATVASSAPEAPLASPAPEAPASPPPEATVSPQPPRYALSPGRRLHAALRRFAIALAGIVGFAVGAGLVLALIFPAVFETEVPRQLAWLILAAVGINVPLFVAALTLCLSPDRPELRLLSATDAEATSAWRGYVGLAILLAVLTRLASLMRMAGEDPADGWFFWLGLVFVVAAAVFTWRKREALSGMMTAPGEPAAPGSWPHVWPRLAVALIVAQWVIAELVLALGSGQSMGGQARLGVIIVLCVPAIDSLIRALSMRLAPGTTGSGQAAQAAGGRVARAYLRMGRVFVYVGLVLLLAKAWGLSLFGLAAGGVGAPVAAGVMRFLTIAAVGYIIFELINIQFLTRLSREATGDAAEPGDVDTEGGGASASRLATVLPLMRWAALAFVAVFTVMLALSQGGVDIAPLIAGASVFGLAIGFGAQKLVSDVVSGLFFLVDDAFRTGEFIDVGGTMGSVEKISVRSVQLRHHLGAVHTIPYGDISKVTNYSRDWVIMKLKFTVPFGTDPNKIKKIFKKIGQEMMEVPEFKADFIEPFKSQGVLEFDDVGIVVRGKFMARPGRQFVLRKEIFNRVNKAFDEAGIEFARREVRVRVTDEEGEDLAPDSPKAQAAVGAAAQAAAQQTGTGGAPADSR